jgi:hypothetical protein
VKFNLSPNRLKTGPGLRRKVVRFAWLPKKLEDEGIVVWLERYISVQKIVTRHSISGYRTTSWLEIEAKGVEE